MDFKKRTDSITDSTQSYFAVFLKQVCSEDNTQALEAADAAYHCNKLAFRRLDPGSKGDTNHDGRRIIQPAQLFCPFLAHAVKNLTTRLGPAVNVN